MRTQVGQSTIKQLACATHLMKTKFAKRNFVRAQIFLTLMSHL